MRPVLLHRSPFRVLVSHLKTPAWDQLISEALGLFCAIPGLCSRHQERWVGPP